MGNKKPSRVVIDLFGCRPLARLLTSAGFEITPGAVHHWLEKGLVPSKYHETLLELAKQKKLKLTADMLVCGV